MTNAASTHTTTAKRSKWKAKKNVAAKRRPVKPKNTGKKTAKKRVSTKPASGPAPE